MKFLLYTTRYGKAGSIQLHRPSFWLPALAGFLTILSAVAWIGYSFGNSPVAPSLLSAATPGDGQWQSAIAEQQLELQQARDQVQNDVNALAVRVGHMQAQVLRMEALGQRLTQVANLDKGEFDFDHRPALGGPADASGQETFGSPDFLQVLDDLQAQIDDRTRQLELIEQISMTRSLSAAILPSGRPITKGWVSSYFGMRNDPFNGRRAMHKGMDFAGKQGSDVIATAEGVVTWAGKRYGYGKLVEINHGNGYSTRYGHAEKILVKVGDKIEPGQTVALMGSSGRSTGPHVHYEVLRKGKQINPAKYIRASR